MIKKKIISSSELSKYGSVNGLNQQIVALLEQQKATWEIARRNFGALTQTQIKNFDFGHFTITAQFNAERIRSSAAKTDAKSIEERPCFLCLENLPEEQKGILFNNQYLILINPYPIFSQHYTISSLLHQPQQILVHFQDLLELSRNLTDFTIFYNGPQCGASAPDHFHFQAIGCGNLRIEKEFNLLIKKHSEILVQTEKTKIAAVESYLRKFIAIISPDRKEIEERFGQLYQLLELNGNEEPMMNILCNYIGNEWRVIIFPRAAQRPSHFFRDEGRKLLVSPAAVEMGGVLVLPREVDFRRITSIEIAEIYEEVSIGTEKFNALKNSLRQ